MSKQKRFIGQARPARKVARRRPWVRIALVALVIIGIIVATVLWFYNPTVSGYTIFFTAIGAVFSLFQNLPALFPKDDDKEPSPQMPQPAPPPIHIHVAPTPSPLSTEAQKSDNNTPPVQAKLLNIPYTHNPCFTGRDEIITALHQTFVAHTRERPVQALVGLGGVGKTQTAVEYAYRYEEEYQTMLWVVASSYQNMVKEYSDLAHLLNLPEKDEQDEDKIVSAVKRWLEHAEGWLLIIDNADEPEFLPSFLPARGKGHILITTRSNALGGATKLIPLPVLGSEEAAVMLLRKSGIIAADGSLHDASASDQLHATAIANRVQGLPLALDQAGAFIQSAGCSLNDYLQMYQTRQSELLRQRGNTLMHPDPVATTWSLSFQQVEQQSVLAIDILKFATFLAADNIPLAFFLEGPKKPKSRKMKLSSALNDPYQLNLALQILMKFSLITRDPQAETISIHSLVQAVQQASMSPDVRSEWLVHTTFWLDHHFPWSDVIRWPQCQTYLSHALKCAEHLITETIQTTQSARLFDKLGRYLYDRGQYVQAEPFFQRALAIREQVLGLEHLDTATILNSLAILYQTQGRHEEAEPLHQRALTIRERVLGPDHPGTAASLNNLAGLYRAQGKYDLAERLHQRAFIIGEQVLGPEHPKTVTALSNLALLYQDQGKYELAEPLYKRALTIDEQVLGPEHPGTATTLNNLAGLYRAQGKYELAEPLYKRALTIREQVLGPEHPGTATTLNNLAKLYLAQGKYELAEPLYKRALTIREQVLGLQNPKTVTVLNNLAGLYKVQGKEDLAEGLLLHGSAIFNMPSQKVDQEE